MKIDSYEEAQQVVLINKRVHFVEALPPVGSPIAFALVQRNMSHKMELHEGQNKQQLFSVNTIGYRIYRV